MNQEHQHIIEQVPPDYYQKGTKKNFLQAYWHSHKLKNVEKFIDKYSNSPKKILDVGCASGWFLSQISKKYSNAKCHGIDVYADGINYGKKLYPKLSLRKADAHKLPYKNNYFDVIISTETLEHVDNPKKVLDEIKRVLKKDGIAIIELDSGSLLFSVVWYIWKKYRGSVWNDSHLHSFTVKKLDRTIKKCGFTVLDKAQFNFGMAMVFAIKK